MKHQEEAIELFKNKNFLTHTVQMKLLNPDDEMFKKYLLNPHGSDETPTALRRVFTPQASS